MLVLGSLESLYNMSTMSMLALSLHRESTDSDNVQIQMKELMMLQGVDCKGIPVIVTIMYLWQYTQLGSALTMYTL